MPAAIAALRQRNLFQELKRLVEPLEATLIIAKLAAMIKRASRIPTRRMLHMQHLVIEHIFDNEARNARAIKRSADYDRAVNVIVMAKDAACRAGAP